METKRKIEKDCLKKYQKAHLFDHTPTLEEWLVYWLETYVKPNCKPNTYTNFYSYIHSHILPMLGDYAIDELQPIELQYYIDEKLTDGRLDGKGGLSIKTVKEHIGLLNTAFKKAITLQMMQYNPAQFVEFPKPKVEEIKVFDAVEQGLLLHAIDTTYQPNSAISILLGLLAGLRIGEVSALRIDDIDFVKRQIRIDESLNRIAHHYREGSVKYDLVYGSTKSNKIRYVPMNDTIYQALQTYFNTMPQTHAMNHRAPLFLNRRGKAIEPRAITYYFQNLMKRLGLQGYHFHCLRHTFATRAVEAQMDIKSCSKILGHATTQITLDRYTHISTDHLYKEMQKLNYQP